MALAERTTNLQFLADGEGLLRTHNLQLPDAPALASLQGNEVGDDAEVVLQLGIDEVGNLLRSVLHGPAVEIVGLQVIVVEHL